MKKIPRAFGLTLLRLREGARMSQQALAAKAGLDRTFISLLERGRRQPTITTLVILCDALDIPLMDMITRFIEELPKKE